MNIFVTGATGFVMSAVARRLVARGDTVRALVRDPARARRLAGDPLAGVAFVAGDLRDETALRSGMDGADAVIHGAAVYDVGISKQQRPLMFETNVRGTAHALSTARAANVGRTVYISTIAVFGNTRGAVVDETYVRTDPTYTSYYEETKVRAHEIAQGFVNDGLPLVFVQPGQVYGPGDHSGFGSLLGAFARGRLPVLPFPDLGLNLTYIDDVAAGIVLALDKGQPGRSCVMGGEIVRTADAFATLAHISGRSAPRWTVPYAVLEAAALFRPQLREVVTSAKGVTFWATDARARAELGYAPRSIEAGLRETYRSSSSSSSSSSDSNSSE
ncbi:MAG TPA: NAD-dependent epimerase/dehydratase family protein [Candidatus Limnocylindrales bacterium]|nr:NAD-dependent epimerase/dehydratase family protein [Candidatus Limnocylindrales bacterium]